MATVVDAGFEWDSDKAESNERKHGVSFEEAAAACDDSLAVERPDVLHPERCNVIGEGFGRVLFVVTVERTERTRIISARKATPREKRDYERGKP